MDADAQKICTHRYARKDRILGADTGDYICPDCKEEFYSREALEAAQKMAEVRLSNG